MARLLYLLAFVMAAGPLRPALADGAGSSLAAPISPTAIADLVAHAPDRPGTYECKLARPQPESALLSPNPPCASKDALAAANQNAYDHAASEPTVDHAALASCFAATQKHLDDCAAEALRRSECRSVIAATAVDGSYRSGQVVDMVAAANCYHIIDHCFTAGSASDPFVAWNTEVSACGVTATPDIWVAAPGPSGDVVHKYFDEVAGLRRDQSQCWRRAGDVAEAAARDVLAEAVCVASDKTVSHPLIDCIDNDNGVRLCEADWQGGRFQQADLVADGAIQSPALLEGANPVLFYGAASCSGTLLGDGMTVITAGHCVVGHQWSRVAVFDVTGLRHDQVANCPSEINNRETTAPDFAVCTLSAPMANVNPVHLAVYDPSLRQADCVADVAAYVLRCGDQFFANYDGRTNARLVAFPDQMDGRTWKHARNIVRSEGPIKWDASNHNFRGHMLCTGGCSGAGYLAAYPQAGVLAGSTVIIGIIVYSDRYSPLRGGGAVIGAEDFRQELEIAAEARHPDMDNTVGIPAGIVTPSP